MLQLLRLLNCPSREFTPIPFWFLNGDLEEGEIRRQLLDFHEHGVYGVVLHPRMGLPQRIEYLSETFFRYIRFAVKTASELEMKVILYDEGMYPSGSAGGLVVRGHPELASQGIVLTEVLQPGDELLAQTAQGALVIRKSGGTIRGIHFGEDDGEPNAPLSADILNPEAVARFIQLTHDAYYRELLPYFGNTVLGFFTDEPCILGREVSGMFPWTHNFAQIFADAGGDPDGLAALFHGGENKDTMLYHRLILEREGKVYYASLARWCDEHDIALMGHPHQSDDIEVERYFHIPGQDLALRWVAPETGGLTGMDSTMAKCGADMARLMGRQRNANECFGACNRDNNPWYLTGGDIKWYLDWLAVRGVNLFIPHAFYYSIEGPRRDERPPDVGPNSIWWPHYRQWAVYMQRLSCLMTDAELHTETAVLCRNRELHSEIVAPLFSRQIGFQYLPESVWAECQEKGHTILCRGKKYSCVLGDSRKFPSVPHSVSAVRPDCICRPPQPKLRCARFTRASTECWFLVNEGDEEIHAKITLPVRRRIGKYDLWTGLSSRCETTNHAEGVMLALHLPVRGSLLLFACTENEWNSLPGAPEEFLCDCPVFQLSEDNCGEVRKVYTAPLIVTQEQLACDKVILTVEAEEMAELFVNESLAGAEFWAPQNFDLRPFLREGKNELRLVVTGSLANLYGKSSVWYGLKNA